MKNVAKIEIFLHDPYSNALCARGGEIGNNAYKCLLQCYYGQPVGSGSLMGAIEGP